MTREEIMAMKPGPELDALVAEKVMGLKRGVDFGEWPEHKWKRDEDGEIDIFGLDIGNHNGPRCERCGYGYCHHCQSGPTEPCKVDPEPYSTDIRAAWQVVEKLISLGWAVWVQGRPDGIPYFANAPEEPEMPIRKKWRADPIYMRGRFSKGEEFEKYARRLLRFDGHGYGDIAPEAICKSALLAVCEEEQME